MVLDDRVSAFVPETGTVHTLSHSASAVWWLLDGTRTLDEVADVLTELSDAGRQRIRADVGELVVRLRADGLLAPGGAGPA